MKAQRRHKYGRGIYHNGVHTGNVCRSIRDIVSAVVNSNKEKEGEKEGMSADVKYELTEEKRIVGDIALYRIRALQDFGDVKAGDLGGWIGSERNLSQNGDAWVSGNAQVFGNAWVSENARVSGDAQVCGKARVFGNAWVFGDAWVFGNTWVFGNAWVSGNARVCGNAQVFGDARVCGNAQVSGNAWVSGNARLRQTSDYLTIGPIGSRESFTTFYWTENGISVSCGCFTGKLDEFAAKVDETHGDNRYGKAYKAAIEAVKQIMAAES